MGPLGGRAVELGDAVRAAARIEVARRGGHDVVVDCRSDPPISIRPTPDRVLIVGCAAAPVGGDEMSLDVVVGPGAQVQMGTAAATMIWPGRGGEVSRQITRLVIADGAGVEWLPEPQVPVAGCRHESRIEVELAATASLVLVEEVALGRSGEQPGRVSTVVRVCRDGRPLIHHGEELGPGVPGWGSAVHVGDLRHVITAVVVGREIGDPRCEVGDDASAALLPVAPDAALLLAAAVDRPTAWTTARRVAHDRACLGLP